MKREYTALIDSDWQDRTIKEYLREELNASSGIIKSLKAYKRRIFPFHLLALTGV